MWWGGEGLVGCQLWKKGDGSGCRQKQGRMPFVSFIIIPYSELIV